VFGWPDSKDLPISEGLYFAWVTATTVGYGDISPTTGLSAFVAIFDAILGIVLTGIIVSIALSAAKLSIKKNGSLDSLSDTAKERVAKVAKARSHATEDSDQ
jgi:voltage-gated potassium channel Kch